VFEAALDAKRNMADGGAAPGQGFGEGVGGFGGGAAAPKLRLPQRK